METQDVTSSNALPRIWKRSSYSGVSGGNCVEVGVGARNLIALRDSKNPGISLTFPRDTWIDLLNEVKLGRYAE
jgi:hypothetical protein